MVCLRGLQYRAATRRVTYIWGFDRILDGRQGISQGRAQRRLSLQGTVPLTCKGMRPTVARAAFICKRMAFVL